MARTGFKLPGFTSWVELLEDTLTEEAAELIVEELQDAGPAWKGEFRNNWVIVPGINQRIPATKESSYSKYQRWIPQPDPEPKQQILAPAAPAGRGEDSGYTIGNVMKYRNIAMDLDPGGWRLQSVGKKKRITAPKDWYVTFAQGGQMRDILEAVTLQVAKDPKIRGYKGRKGFK